MDIGAALDFIGTHRRGVLVTERADGRPQLSNIAYNTDQSSADTRVIRISVTDGRAKTANLRRTPKASLHVTRDDFYAYAVVDCDVTLSAVAATPDDTAVEELVALYRSVAGEHPDWSEFRAAMVNDHRLVVRLHPYHAYGMLGG